MSEASTTKARILDAALRLFADKGYESTTMADLAGAVGIKPASLFSHYKGKEVIFRETLEHALSDWEATVKGIFAAAAGIPGLEEGVTAVLAGFAGAIGGSVSYRFWARLYVFPPPVVTAADAERFYAMDRRLEALLVDYSSARMEPGVPRERVETYVAVLANLTMGAMVNGIARDPAALAAELERGVRFLSAALAAPTDALTKARTAAPEARDRGESQGGTR